MARTVTNQLDALLKDGFARPRAQEYLKILAEESDTPTGDAAATFNHDAVDGYDQGLFDPDYCEWAHSHGFFAKQAYCYDLSESNIDDYLCDYDYHRIWPLNSWQRIWINDKLTLKYMLSGTEFDKYLPEYYYYSTANGPLPLLNSSLKPGEGAFLDTLRSVGEFACKPCNGSRTVGFHKLSYVDGDYLVDNKPSSKDGVLQFLHENPNFVFTEFMHPSAQMAEVSPVINNLRLQVFNPTGVDPWIGCAYFRIAMDVNGDDSKTNYRYPSKADYGNYNVSFNWENGHYGDGTIIYANRVVKSPCSPDTGALAEGTLEGWQEVVEMTLAMSERLNPLEYLGYDVCITDHGPKVIEINSFSGSKYLQYFHPFLKNERLAEYFRAKVEEVDALGADEVARRNGIIR